MISLEVRVVQMFGKLMFRLEVSKGPEFTGDWINKMAKLKQASLHPGGHARMR